MEKKTLNDIINDLRSRFDALSLCCRRPYANITIDMVANGRRQASLIVSIYALYCI